MTQRSGSATWTYAGVFLIAAATLLLEVLLTRLMSVMAWYHLAFFVISLVMLGMTAGAVIVFVSPERFPDRLVPARLAQSALGFAASIPFAVTLALSLPLEPVTDLMTFSALLLIGGVLALPFVLAGVALTLALTRSALPTGLVYGVDLIGAASGCALAIPLLDLVDGASAAILAGALAALAAAAFALAGARRTTPALALAGALALAAFGNAESEPKFVRPTWIKGVREQPDHFMYTGWNTYSRVTVSKPTTREPIYWGLGRNAPPDARAEREQRLIWIDGGAGTTMAKLGSSPASHGYLAYDVTSTVHALRSRGPAAVIGVGGGRDVLEAARVGHSPIVGIELNELIVDLHLRRMDAFSGIAHMPGVVLIADEARSHFARNRQRYAVITMSMIDTWAATGAGAYSLSEHGLYTVEAWRTFVSRLLPGGIFTVSRWYVAGAPGETARMLVLAMDTLWSLGKREPRDHIVVLQVDRVATLLLSRDPFSEHDLDAVERIAAQRGFDVLFSPRMQPAHPLLRELAGQPTRAALQSWASGQEFDLTPPTDARPFFFNMLKPRTWLARKKDVNGMDLAFLGNLGATQTLLYATLVSVLLAVLTLAWPMRRRVADLRALGRADLTAALAYFALIGLGFMFVEMAILSRLSVFLGHPTLALAVLLCGIISFTGVGSMLSTRIDLESARARYYPWIAAALIAVTSVALAPVMDRLVAASASTRVLASLALLLPPALGMGLCFPLGLRLSERMERARVKGSAPRLGPWLWGINGAFSVSASGLGLACSMVWGVHVTLLLGALCYSVLPLATTRLWRSGRA